ncbi:MAG: bifunctional adenosylcobinamide kinase/adenosylcobinamide-phosphate guanylyltransferase [Cellulosilyticum sp.]|nr:bifunctional adenosylcobinamide kinase/adenosylcobinamide-phosphate guanylyltransferase [Cellulosilyticum sp.]
MSEIILVTGGARSGKSHYAESLCRARDNATAYIATSIPFDDELKDRVKKHRQMRPSHWDTYEIYEDVYRIIPEVAKTYQTVILDCVTLMVNNLMFKEDLNYDQMTALEIEALEMRIKEQCEKLIEAVKQTKLYFVIVTNEIGLCPVAANRLTRIYTDIIGRMNQLIAKASDEVYFVVSGIPMKIKGDR